MPRLPPQIRHRLTPLGNALRRAAWVVTALVCASVARPALADDPAGLAASVSTMIVELDSDRFDVRQRAASRLQAMIEAPATSKIAARAIRQTLERPELTFEVRKQLESWLPRLPAAPGEKSAANRDADLAQLIAQLEDDSYALRLGARRRLERLADDPAHAARLTFLLHDRLAEPNLSTDSYRRLLALWQRARGAWLTSDPRDWDLPPPSDPSIERVVAALAKAAPAAAPTSWPAHQAARRKLLDMLAHDEAVPRIKRAIQAALTADGVDPEASTRFDPLLELTIPALVAEIWKSHENILVQYLYVDVPQQVGGAPRPSHFSRIDDQTAQCESGSNLLPGEYRVGTAIPHPAGDDWICQLINLPNPRRRQAYEHALLVDPRTRLAELTERTMRDLAARRQPMSDQLINLLDKLDAAALSVQIGSYLMAVEDRTLEEGSDIAGGPAATHHQRVCFMLGMLGTKQAGPGLVRVIEAKRCRPASFETTPYQWPQIAALAIAARDPWPDAGHWLASQIGNAEPLVLIPAGDDETHGQPPAGAAALPQLGAGAAALLLKQHDMAPGSFGLVPVRSQPLENMDCPCYRFASAKDHQRVVAWWRLVQQGRDREQAP